MKHRIYLVGQGQTVRLVRAGHRAQALSHVARSLFNVKVANQDELIEAITRGISVESAATDLETPELDFDVEKAPAEGATA